MVCYNCGCRLSEQNFCTACGADVSLYKKIVQVSNKYYNDGLEKAGIRDLTGAIACLRQSLKLNKNNVEARNLLGLVYFEIGEVVAALSEWVISKNLQPDKNIADTYLSMIQSNAARLDSFNQTIKKYNQALVYCRQDSKDLAVIQLKKVLSLNSKFIRAHQLLALLYIEAQQWDKAKRELNKCADIDCSNTKTIRYLKEVNQILDSSELERSVKQEKNKEKNAHRYQTDNEVIIQPMTIMEPKRSGGGTVINILIGLMLGIAVMYFLVVPSVKSKVNSEAQEEIVRIGNQIDEKNSNITELESQITDLIEKNDELNKELEAYVGTDGTLQTMETLLNCTTTYLETQDMKQVATSLESIAAEITLEDTSESFQGLYNALITLIGPEMSELYYTDGNTAYQSQDYVSAVDNFKKSIYYNETNANAYYNLGNAYRQSGNSQEAITAYQKVIELVPGTERARKSQNYVDELNG